MFPTPLTKNDYSNRQESFGKSYRSTASGFSLYMPSAVSYCSEVSIDPEIENDNEIDYERDYNIDDSSSSSDYDCSSVIESSLTDYEISMEESARWMVTPHEMNCETELNHPLTIQESDNMINQLGDEDEDAYTYVTVEGNSAMSSAILDDDESAPSMCSSYDPQQFGSFDFDDFDDETIDGHSCFSKKDNNKDTRTFCKTIDTALTEDLSLGDIEESVSIVPSLFSPSITLDRIRKRRNDALAKLSSSFNEKIDVISPSLPRRKSDSSVKELRSSIQDSRERLKEMFSQVVAERKIELAKSA
jgi:hypothetical protein